jgi:hypothetical protein
MREADNLTAICEPIFQKWWDPQHISGPGVRMTSLLQCKQKGEGKNRKDKILLWLLNKPHSNFTGECYTLRVEHTRQSTV